MNEDIDQDEDIIVVTAPCQTQIKVHSSKKKRKLLMFVKLLKGEMVEDPNLDDSKLTKGKWLEKVLLDPVKAWVTYLSELDKKRTKEAFWKAVMLTFTSFNEENETQKLYSLLKVNEGILKNIAVCE